jgi:hypothetical protein
MGAADDIKKGLTKGLKTFTKQPQGRGKAEQRWALAIVADD